MLPNDEKMKLHWKNIFLADDDEDDCEFFADALTEINADAKLTAAKNGNELMNLLQQNTASQPDIIFLDLNMPVKNGYQCLEEIRKDETLQDHVVVIFTTSSLKEDIDKLYKMGASLFITKPNDFDKLKEVIKKVFSLDVLKERSRPKRENFVVR